MNAISQLSKTVSLVITLFHCVFIQYIVALGTIEGKDSVKIRWLILGGNGTEGALCSASAFIAYVLRFAYFATNQLCDVT